MDPAVIDLLACPHCRHRLQLTEQPAAEMHAIQTGGLLCSGCGRTFRIRDGIAELLSTAPPLTAAQIVNRLSPTAWAYERVWRPYALSRLSGSTFPAEEELEMMAEATQAAQGGVLLDVACGNGFYAREMARRAQSAAQPAHVIALDHSLPMLDEAARRAQQAAVNITFLLAAAQRVPLRNGSIDAIAVGGSWNEIGDEAPVAAECARLLRPGGKLMLMYLAANPRGVAGVIQTLMRPGGLQFPSETALVARFTAHGMQPIQSMQRGIVTFTTFQR